ncbi:hypothetical protein GUJ93_ZPchr0013g34790 [Zizania palustris]|uniref:Uncharacterized protein n=1 Tax=Zizania palustris TaxID=103762 RepID=A0A8J6BXL2_ZIZPA|nr:hypothetical protein GUJ93_ZPchr0013g34790 [Zizania palustris]
MNALQIYSSQYTASLALEQQVECTSLEHVFLASFVISRLWDSELNGWEFEAKNTKFAKVFSWMLGASEASARNKNQFLCSETCFFVTAKQIM